AADAVGQACHIVAGGLQLLGAGASRLAIVADHQNRALAVFFQLADARGQLVHRDVDRVDNVTGGKVLLRTNVQHQGVALVDQVGGLLGAEGGAGTAAFGNDKQGQHHQKGDDQHQVVADKFDELLEKLHVGLLPRYQRKWSSI